MKKLYTSLFIFVCLLITAFNISGCKLNSELAAKNATTGATVNADRKTTLNISLFCSARTALPSINWNDFTYELKGLKSGSSEEDLFVDGNGAAKKRTYDELSNPIIASAAQYKLTLNAYSGSTKVLSGTQNVNLATGGKDVSFIMYPVTGTKGSAKITVKFPNDGTVRTVKALISEDFIAGPSGAETVAFDNVTTHNQFIYQKDNLTAGAENYAHFWLYDASNGLVANYTESIIVVGSLTSTATVEFTADDYGHYSVAVSLFKDNEKWLNSNKLITLENTITGTTYALADDRSVFKGKVTEGTYNIKINNVDTGKTLFFTDKTASINYYSVKYQPGDGINLSTVEGGEDFYGTTIVPEGNDLIYSATLKNGFTNPASFTITVNGVSKTQDFNPRLTYANVSAPITISTTGAAPIQYTITYEVTSDDGSWLAGANKPTSYDVLTGVDLPTDRDFRGQGKVLDGWKLKGTDEQIGYIQPDTISGNITLIPMWKEAAWVDTTNKIIYAEGYSLIIEEHGTETFVFYDINANGKHASSVGAEEDDKRDVQILGIKNGVDVYDFSGYKLMARGRDPSKAILSDFTFTMTGGSIASITGLGANAANRSTLNISGTAKIGGYTTVAADESNGDEETEDTFINVTGVELSSISNEWVIVNGQMSGDYNVVLITQYDYDANVNHYVGSIGNSNWADFSKFKCFKQETPGSASYIIKPIGMKAVGDSTIIRLINPNPIALPGITGDDRIIGDVNSGFQLGEDRISTGCSVFSVSIEDGTFTVPETTLEGGTDYLAEYKNNSGTILYEQSLNTTRNYIYIHVLSSSSEISPEKASEYLAGITFKRNAATPDKPCKVKVNLETVPFAEISSGPTYNGELDTPSNKAFAYFNGHFYMGVNNATNCNWIYAYNQAKKLEFNGLGGYLLTITNDVENNYIFKRMGLGASWIGGARYDTLEDYTNGDFPKLLNVQYHVTYDSDSREEPGAGFRTDAPAYRWQCGPEAGQIFTTGTIPLQTSVSGGTVISSTWSTIYRGFQTTQNNANAGKLAYIYDNYYNKIGETTLPTPEKKGSWTSNYYFIIPTTDYTGTPKYLYPATDAPVITATGSTTGTGTYQSNKNYPMYQNWATNEPNDSYGGTSEECVHYKKEGDWNDYNWDRTGVNIQGYIVEFSPYGKYLETLKYPAVTSEAEY